MTEITRDEWVAGLRSGDYTQYRGALAKAKKLNNHTEEYELEGNCCLGVYCELSNFDKIVDDLGYEYVFDGLGLRTTLMGAKPSWMSHSQETVLMNANDVWAWTFDDIADWADSGMKVVAVGFNSYFRPLMENKVFQSLWPNKNENNTYGWVKFDPKFHSVVE